MDEVKTKSNLTQNLKKRGGDSSTVAQIDQDEKMVCNTFYFVLFCTYCMSYSKIKPNEKTLKLINNQIP